MFTGIISEIAKVEKATMSGALIKLVVDAKKLSREAKPSDSISLNGVCLTIIKKDNNFLFFEAMPSTLKNTNLKRLKKSSFINLEPALAAGDKVGGHFVLGHVDAELKLRRKIKKPGNWELEIELPSRFRKFILANGSVAIDGISLTVKKVLSKAFTVHILEFTYKNTTIQYMRSGDRLNVEFDYLLKKGSGG